MLPSSSRQQYLSRQSTSTIFCLLYVGIRIPSFFRNDNAMPMKNRENVPHSVPQLIDDVQEHQAKWRGQ
jgi:hypothetical protein